MKRRFKTTIKCRQIIQRIFIIRPMRWRTYLGLFLAVGIALELVVAVFLYWRFFSGPWHIVNLNNYFQARIANATPHDNNRRNNLARLPAGLKIFNGVRFKVAGIIQLADKNDSTQPNHPYPESVRGIPVKRICQKIHILHGTTHSTAFGAAVSSLVLHYTDGTTEKLDIVYGRQVYDWWFRGGDEVPLANNTQIAWIGQNPYAAKYDSRVRVFKTTFDNLKPGVRIDTIDYVSALSPSAPFMIAMTVE